MVLYVILMFVAILVGMAVSVFAFGTGGKRSRVFQDIYFTVEEVDGIGILYTKNGDYSAVLEMENPVLKYSANIDAYYGFTSLLNSLTQTLGEGYALHKQDIFCRRRFHHGVKGSGEFLSASYFRYFEGREYTDARTYLVITQESRGSKLFSYDARKWRDFMVKAVKVRDQLRDAGIACRFLGKKEASDYVDRYFALDFTSPTVSMTGLKVDEEEILMGDRKCRFYSLVDVDSVALPSLIRPFTSIEVNNSSMPVDLVAAVDSVPDAQTVVYNQVIFMPGQKKEMSALEKKRNRHGSIPSPANQMAVEDIKAVQEVIAREGKQLVYCHFSIGVVTGRDTDIHKCTNYLENAFGRQGIHLSKRAYNQLELFVGSFPGNCYSLSPDYDRFLTLGDAAACLMYKERTVRSEDTPLKIWYTDRQGVPVAIDISGKEGREKITDNANFFCLGPSGSGKSFHMNSVVRQMWEQDTDIVMVDTGNSYEGLCEYAGGKYISYTEEHPITMNPFRITRAEYNIEKVGFLRKEYYDNHFAGRIDTLCFNSFYEFSVERIPQICEENHLAGIDLAAYNYLMKDFYKGGNHEVTLNEDLDTTLFDETFIVFEIDSIKDDPLLFPLVTLIIMDLFIQKMRIKKNRKVLIIEEAWKAIASPMMAEYIKYMYKTARKFWASVGVVTQEIQDIVGSPIVKEAIINNSDVVMLLDQSKFRERFDEIQTILGLTEVDCKKIFTINRLENKDGRSFFREVFIRRGQKGAVYGVEEPRECYMTYTTERSEKEALKIYRTELGCDHRTAVEAYCRDWERSGLGAPLAFAQRVNAAGHVLNLPKP